MRYSSKPLALALVFALAVPVYAQLAPGKFGFSANNSQLNSTPPGVRLDGNAIVRIPEMEVRADVIAFDGRNLQTFTEVRGRGNVRMNVTQTPKKGKEAIQIQSKSDEATLTRVAKTLVLKGNLSGFYRVGNGPQTMLVGSIATFNFAGAGLNALIESAAGKQVELLLPGETGKADAIGPVTVRADSLRVDQANNAAYFSGNARALSDSGANKLDVAAPSFTLTRASDGTIGTLVTNGKTVTKINVAPDASAKPGGKALSYVELTADKATVNRATSTGVFDGNVKGFYRLQDSPQKFDLSGERVTVTYDSQAAKNGDGLNVNVTGSPVTVELPEFNLGF